VHLSLQGIYCILYFSNNPTEKSHVLLGPVNEVAMALYKSKKAPAAETKGEAQPC
jgi:hypothetical protein